MALSSSAYARVKFIVGTNATLQAQGDAKDFPFHKIDDILNDVFSQEASLGVLKSWGRGSKADMAFHNVNKTDRMAMSIREREDLIQFWIEDYWDKVTKLLRERVQRGT